MSSDDCKNGWIKGKAALGVQLPCPNHWPEGLNKPGEKTQPALARAEPRMLPVKSPVPPAEGVSRRTSYFDAPRSPQEASGDVIPYKHRDGAPYAKIAWAAGQRLCRWCLKRVTKGQGQGHHILPRANGGTDEADNIALVHSEGCHNAIEGLTMMIGREPTSDQIRYAREIFSQL